MKYEVKKVEGQTTERAFADGNNSKRCRNCRIGLQSTYNCLYGQILEFRPYLKCPNVLYISFIVLA